MSLEWTGRHHSRQGDFTDLSSHTVTYETETTDYVTVAGKLVGVGPYEYVRLDEQVGVVTYYPQEYQGLANVVLRAILNFAEGTDRAVIEHEGKTFVVADGTFRQVPTPAKPAS